MEELDYNRARKVLLKLYSFLSVEDVEDAMHDALLYMLENPPPSTVKPITALFKVFKTIRFTEYRRKFIAWTGDRTPVYLISVDFDVILNGDTSEEPLTGQELSIRNDMMELGYSYEMEYQQGTDYWYSAVSDKLKQLRPHEREAVSLFLAGYNKKQVASIVGVTPQAIDSRFKKGMRRL